MQAVQGEMGPQKCFSVLWLNGSRCLGIFFPFSICGYKKCVCSVCVSVSIFHGYAHIHTLETDIS